MIVGKGTCNMGVCEPDDSIKGGEMEGDEERERREGQQIGKEESKAVWTVSSRLSKNIKGFFYILMISSNQCSISREQGVGRHSRHGGIHSTLELPAPPHPAIYIFSISSSSFFGFLPFLSHSRLWLSLF